jgi:hypothetical protein
MENVVRGDSEPSHGDTTRGTVMHLPAPLPYGGYRFNRSRSEIYPRLTGRTPARPALPPPSTTRLVPLM